MNKLTSPPTPQKEADLESKPSIKIACKLGARRPYWTLLLSQRAGTGFTVIIVYHSALLQTDRRGFFSQRLKFWGLPYYSECISICKGSGQPERCSDGKVCKTLSHISGRESSSADAECLQKYLCLFEDLRRCATGISMRQQRPLMEERNPPSLRSKVNNDLLP